jgi:hypothetical protein
MHQDVSGIGGSEIYTRYQKRTIGYGVIALVLFLLLTACATSSNPASTTTQARPTVVYGTSIASTPGVGPTVIPMPTTASSGNLHGQLVRLADRTFTLSSVSKQAGPDSNSTAISLTMTIKNTSAKPIMNEATFFQLISSEGDTFAVETSVTPNFFGAIGPRSSRTATLVFQVPSAAVNGLHLLYRPEVPTEAIIVALNFS